MKVVIDGVEYAPKYENKIQIHGIDYDSVPHWLMNIHCKLVSDWVNSVRNNGGYPENGDKELHDKIDEFEKLCINYLGFERKKGDIGFEEIKSDS